MVSHRTTAFFCEGVGLKDDSKGEGLGWILGGLKGLNHVRPPHPVVLCGDLPMIHAYESFNLK